MTASFPSMVRTFSGESAFASSCSMTEYERTSLPFGLSAMGWGFRAGSFAASTERREACPRVMRPWLPLLPSGAGCLRSTTTIFLPQCHVLSVRTYLLRAQAAVGLGPWNPFGMHPLPTDGASLLGPCGSWIAQKETHSPWTPSSCMPNGFWHAWHLAQLRQLPFGDWRKYASVRPCAPQCGQSLRMSFQT